MLQGVHIDLTGKETIWIQLAWFLSHQHRTNAYLPYRFCTGGHMNEKHMGTLVTRVPRIREAWASANSISRQAASSGGWQVERQGWIGNILQKQSVSQEPIRFLPMLHLGSTQVSQILTCNYDFKAVI